MAALFIVLAVLSIVILPCFVFNCSTLFKYICMLHFLVVYSLIVLLLFALPGYILLRHSLSLVLIVAVPVAVFDSKFDCGGPWWYF